MKRKVVDRRWNCPIEERERKRERERERERENAGEETGTREDRGRTSVPRKFPLSDLLERTTTRSGSRLFPPEQRHDLRRGGSGAECQD